MKSTKFSYLVYAWIIFLVLGMIFMFAYVGHAEQNGVRLTSIEYLDNARKLGSEIWTQFELSRTLVALDVIGTIFLSFWGITWIFIVILNAVNNTFKNKNQTLWIITFFMPIAALFDK